MSFWNNYLETCWFNTHLHVFFNGLQNFHVELLYRNDRKVHVAEQTVDHLQEGLLHAGEALLQQLWGQRQGESSDTRFHTEAPRSPSTFTTAHFLRKEKKILTAEEGEMLIKGNAVGLIYKCNIQGLPWWARGEDSVLPQQGAQGVIPA